MGKDSLFANRRLVIGSALILSVMSVSFIQWPRLVPAEPYRVFGFVLFAGFTIWFVYSLWSKGGAFLLDFCHYVVEVFGAIGIVVLGFALGVDRLMDEFARSLTPLRTVILTAGLAIIYLLFRFLRWFGRQVFGED